MSAFVVNKAHIDALVRVAIDGPQAYSDNLWRFARPWGEADELGQMLWDENRASVAFRYSVPVARIPYKFSRTGRCPRAVEALKLIDCYEYQSCEHPRWEHSEAKRFCGWLREALIDALPGYDKASWQWTEAEVAS